MRRHLASRSSLTDSAGVIVLLILSIFATELTVMELLSPVFSRLGSVVAAVLDATATVAILAVPFWFSFSRLLKDSDDPSGHKRPAPLALLIRALSGIFLVEFLAMRMLPRLLPDASPDTVNLIDALLASLAGVPLWFVFARGERGKRETPVMVTPLGLFVLLLCAVFLSDLLQELLVRPGVGMDVPGKVVDALVTTLCGAPLLWLLVIRPLNGATRTEQIRVAAMHAQTTDAIVSVDVSGTLCSFNPAAEEIFGRRADEVIGGEAAVLFSAGKAGLDALIARAGIASHCPRQLPVCVEVACLDSDGGSVIMDVSISEVRLERRVEYLLIMRDVTERVRLQKKDLELQARLIHANKMTSLGLLVSGVAHEINNPNGLVLANAELLERITEDALIALREYGEDLPGHGEPYIGGIPMSQLGEQTKSLLKGIRDGAQRVDDIVSNMKSFAREERRQAMREVDLNQVARSAVSLVNHELIRHTDNFRFDPAEGLPPVWGYQQQLGQVIINLLVNACQALPTRSCRIWLSTSFDADRNLVEIAVGDEGRGIPSEEGERILEPFFSTKLDQGGTGLGLSICDSIIKEHGGAIGFVSQPGSGTTFTVRLPAALPPAAGAATSEPAAGGESAGQTPERDRPDEQAG